MAANLEEISDGLQARSNGSNSNLLAMASNLLAMASNLEAMASNLLQPTSDGLQPRSSNLVGAQFLDTHVLNEKHRRLHASCAFNALTYPSPGGSISRAAHLPGRSSIA